MNTNTMPLEAETRILIDRSLENLGWKLNGKEQNVFYEQPRTEAEKKKLGGKRPDYVLYSKESDKPLKLSTNELLICNEMSINGLITEHRGYQTKLRDFKKSVSDHCLEMGYK